MYLDTVVVSGVVIVVLTCVVVGYVGRYMLRHMRKDTPENEAKKPS